LVRLGSLDSKDFARAMNLTAHPERAKEPPRAGNLANKIRIYPDTIGLKLQIHTPGHQQDRGRPLPKCAVKPRSDGGGEKLGHFGGVSGATVVVDIWNVEASVTSVRLIRD
jgi:hypothetical protein